MKQQMIKWLGVGILILTAGILVALKQLPESPGLELKTGEYGNVIAKNIISPDVQVKRPMGVAVQNNIVAVADAGNKRVVLYNGDTKKKSVINKAGDQGEFSYPVDTAFGPHGTLYVADMYRGKVFGFNEEGKLLEAYPVAEEGEKTGGLSPTAVSVDKEGNLYVTDVAMHRVLVFGPGGKLLFQFGKEGSGEGEFLYPNGIAVSEKKDRIYVADTNNSRIQVFNGRGKFLQVLNLPGAVNLSSPRGIIVRENELFITSALNNQVYRFNPERGETDNISLQGGFRFPNDIAMDKGRFYVADRGNDRLISFTIKSARISEVRRFE